MREIGRKYKQGNKLREHVSEAGQSEPNWRCSAAPKAPENVRSNNSDEMPEWGGMAG